VHAVPPQPADHITTLHVTHYKLPASLSPSLSLCLPLKFVLSFSLALPPIVSSIDVTRGGQTSVNVFYTGCTHNQRERERERERNLSRRWSSPLRCHVGGSCIVGVQNPRFGERCGQTCCNGKLPKSGRLIIVAFTPGTGRPGPPIRAQMSPSLVTANKLQFEAAVHTGTGDSGRGTVDGGRVGSVSG